MKLNKIALVAAVLFASQSAFATDVYVGAGVGQSRLYSGDVDNLSRYPGVSIDKKDTAGKVFVGAQFNRNFGLEASYFDLGDFTASAGGHEVASVGAKGVGLDLVGTLPLTERFSVLGRLGLTNTRINGEAYGYSDHVNVTRPKAGVGLQYKLTDNLAVRGDYEYYRTNASYNGYSERSHVNVASANLIYTFGRAPQPAYVSKTSTTTTYTAPAPAPVVEAPAPTPAPEAPVVTKKKVRE